MRRPNGLRVDTENILGNDYHRIVVDEDFLAMQHTCFVCKKLIALTQGVTIEGMETRHTDEDICNGIVRQIPDYLKMKVGDTVRINEHGVRTFTCGRHLPLFLIQALRKKKVKITAIDWQSMTDDIPTHLVEIDDPELNELMWTHLDFDPVNG